MRSSPTSVAALLKGDRTAEPLRRALKMGAATHGKRHAPSFAQGRVFLYVCVNYWAYSPRQEMSNLFVRVAREASTN